MATNLGERKLNSNLLNRTICIKMDLALNNLQRLICHKTQTNNQLKFNVPALLIEKIKLLNQVLIWAKTPCFHFNINDFGKGTKPLLPAQSNLHKISYH